MPGWNYEPTVVSATDALALLRQVRQENPRRTPLTPMQGYKGKFLGWGPAVVFTSKDDPTKTFKAVSVRIGLNIGDVQREFVLSPESGKDYAAVFTTPDTKIIFDLVEDSKGNREMRNVKIDG